MASVFDGLVEFARSAIDATFGEAVTLKPMTVSKGPHGRSSPSSERAETMISIAFFHDTERAARMRAQPSVASGSGERLLNREPEVLGSVANVPEIATGDLIVKASGETFEVIARDPDGVGNVILGLVAVRV